MATIRQIADKYNKLYNDIRKIAEEIVQSDELQLMELNRIQLSRGLTSDNTYITPEYRSGAYAVYKARKGSRSPFGTPDLKDTGNFYQSLYLGDKFTIQSNIPYADNLVKRYGESIYGISKEDLKLYVQTSFIPKLKQKIATL